MAAEVIAEVITKLVEAAKNLFTFLTVGRLALLACLIIIGLGTVMIWENRQPIYTTLTAGEKYSAIESIPNTLSDTSVKLIQNVVNRQTNIVAIQIVGVDFRRNTRDTTFFFSKVGALQNEYNDYMNSKVSSPALFEKDNEIANQRVVRIMEIEFVCVQELPQNVLWMTPSATGRVGEICSLAIPPRFGKIVGYINIWLEKPMTPQQAANYKSVTRQLADEIYDRDVLQIKI